MTGDGMKLTDYVAEFLAKENVKHVFGLTGGAVVHIFDSLARHPDIQPIFNHHEQAASFAAEAYARVTNELGAAVVTTGPGGTNAVTGVCAAWQDSVPCIYISGQTRYEHTSRGKSVRQVGTQEFDIVSLVSPITKYAVMVDTPQKIKYYLQKAVYMAKTGRPGPVWVDIPLNFQWASVVPEELESFVPPEDKKTATANADLNKLINRCSELLTKAKRPVILAGYGVRLSKAEKEFEQIIDTLGCPFVSSWNASDLLPTDNSNYIGRIGIAGQRGANLAVQNCDLLLAIGSHLSIQLTGTMYEAFARDAKIIMVDIDSNEIKHETVRVDVPIQSDAKAFLQKLITCLKDYSFTDISWWREKCLKYKSFNYAVKEVNKEHNYVDPNVFVETMSDYLDENDVIVVDGGGTALYTSFQSLKTKYGQRLIVSAGIAAMGTGLPESIGACFASGGKRTLCLCGDGSMQLNIQELLTISYHKLPIKMVVFNNSGYLAIRHTQTSFLDSRFTGSSKGGGIDMPDIQKIANAFNIKSLKILNHDNLEEQIKLFLNEEGPCLCEIVISDDQKLIAAQGFEKKQDGTFAPRPLEEMEPFMEREEFLENMVIEPWPSNQ